MYKINNIWDEFPNIKNDLIKCKNKLNEFIDIPNRKVDESVKKLFNSNSKFIRPSLMIIFGHIYKENLDDDFINLAATIELIHNATLIHDDVIDNSFTRRGEVTIHNKFGNTIAIYAGDYMLSKSFKNLLYYSHNLDNARKIMKSVENVLCGELIQEENRYNLNILEETYFDIIRKKTAELLAIACYEGVYLTSFDVKKAEKAFEFGINLGIAFQIIDDLKDILSSKKEIGKTVKHDFNEGYYTLPVIKISNKYNKDLLEIREGRKSDLEDLLKKSGSIEFVYKIAENYIEKARNIAGEFEDNMYRTYLIKVLGILCKGL